MKLMPIQTSTNFTSRKSNYRINGQIDKNNSKQSDRIAASAVAYLLALSTIFSTAKPIMAADKNYCDTFVSSKSLSADETGVYEEKLEEVEVKPIPSFNPSLNDDNKFDLHNALPITWVEDYSGWDNTINKYIDAVTDENGIDYRKLSNEVQKAKNKASESEKQAAKVRIKFFDLYDKTSIYDKKGIAQLQELIYQDHNLRDKAAYYTKLAEKLEEVCE